MSDPTPPNAGQPYPPPYGQPVQQPQYPAQQPQYPEPQPYGQPYAQPQYPQQQYYPAYAAPARPTNTMAVVSLVSGIAGLSIVPFIGSVVAVIVGPMARRRIQETGEQGDGMALAGIITGWIGVALGALGLVFLILIPVLIVASTSAAG